jgi:hypothetical protein
MVKMADLLTAVLPMGMSQKREAGRAGGLTPPMHHRAFSRFRLGLPFYPDPLSTFPKFVLGLSDKSVE